VSKNKQNSQECYDFGVTLELNSQVFSNNHVASTAGSPKLNPLENSVLNMVYSLFSIYNNVLILSHLCGCLQGSPK